MDTSAIYVCLAALFAFIIPIHEGFKIEVDPSINWEGIADTCKKPFTYISEGVTNKIYNPTKTTIIKAIPFKERFRKWKRTKRIEKITKHKENR